MNIHVDTLEYANVLVKSGMERPQAEAVAKLQAQTVKDLIDHELVTKDDLEAGLGQLELTLRHEIRGETTTLREEIRGEAAKLRDEFRGEAAKLRDEFRGEAANLRDEIRGETTNLREEIRGEAAKLRDEIRGEAAKLRDEIRGETTNLREEIRNESATNRRQTDALMIQIRALQLGGAIAAFAIAAIVFLTRLIK